MRLTLRLMAQTNHTVLKGAKQLLTDKFLFVTVFRCQIWQDKKAKGYAILLIVLFTGYLL